MGSAGQEGGNVSEAQGQVLSRRKDCSHSSDPSTLGEMQLQKCGVHSL